MSILITGGAGYIGSHMTWLLNEAGHHVVVMMISRQGTASPFLHLPFFEGSIRDKELCIISSQHTRLILSFILQPISMLESLFFILLETQNNIGATLIF